MKSASVRHLLITFILSITILAIVVLVAALNGITMDRATRDVVALVPGMHPFAGILSNLGILLWCATASVCLFVAIAIRGKVPGNTFRFLLASALLTAWILFDDLFLFHEELARRHLGGMSEKVVMGILGMFVSTYLVAFRRTILTTNYFPLVIAFGFLASSVVVDSIFEKWLMSRVDHWTYLIEDGPKWLGISYWCYYYVTTAHQFLGDAYRMPSKGAAPAHLSD